jgi:hypothetical protein
VPESTKQSIQTSSLRALHFLEIRAEKNELRSVLKLGYLSIFVVIPNPSGLTSSVLN